MKANIHINGIAKESEKAICIIALVSFNANAPKERNIWVPKSLTGRRTETSIEIESWFLDKLAAENEFHGYRMNFDGYSAGLVYNI